MSKLQLCCLKGAFDSGTRPTAQQQLWREQENPAQSSQHAAWKTKSDTGISTNCCEYSRLDNRILQSRTMSTKVHQHSSCSSQRKSSWHYLRYFCAAMGYIILLTSCEVEGNITQLLKRDQVEMWNLNFTLLVQKASYELPCLHFMHDANAESHDQVEMLHRTLRNNNLLLVGGTFRSCYTGVIVCRRYEAARKILQSLVLTSKVRIFLLVPTQQVAEHLTADTSLFGDTGVLLSGGNLLLQLPPGVVAPRQFLTNPQNTRLFLDTPNIHTDARGKTLVVCTYHCPPYNFVDYGQGNGLEVAILDVATQRLGMHWRAVYPPPDDVYGNISPNGSYSGGLIGRLCSRQAHVSFCSMWITTSKLAYIDMSYPWEKACIKFLAPRPSRRHTWLAVFQPLEGTVWGVLGGAVVSMAIVMRLLAVPLSRRNNMARKYLNLERDLLDVLGALLLTSCPDEVLMPLPLRLMQMCWCVVGLLTATAYSSTLVTHLTIPHTAPPLDSVEDMTKAGLTWGIQYATDASLIFDLQNPWHAEFASRFQREHGQEDRQHRLHHNDYAIHVEELEDTAFVEGFSVDVDTLDNLRLIKECVNHFHLGFGLRKDSPLTDFFSTTILTLMERGLIAFWRHQILQHRQKLKLMAVSSVEMTLSSEPQVLHISNLGGAFLLLAVGLTFATLTFLIELGLEAMCKENKLGSYA